MSPYGAPQETVPIRLNVNENTHGIPDAVADDIAKALVVALRTVNRYPDREFTALREALALYVGHGLRRENIWAANGSNEVLQQVVQAFGGPGRTALGFTPTYSMHSIIAAVNSTRWIEAPRDPEFNVTTELALAALARDKPDIIFLCAPNNPTGTPLALETVRRIYDETPGIVLVDEAYAEFGDGTTALSLLPGRPRLIVSRTMSKAFAFAGARVGYLAGDPAVTDAMRLVRLPYHLSALTQAAAVAALGHTGTMLSTVADIRRQRDLLSQELPGLGFTPWPSEANFVLFGGVRDPQDTFGRLFERGILIRDVGIPEHLRVTAGTAQETSAFLSALAELDASNRSADPARPPATEGTTTAIDRIGI